MLLGALYYTSCIIGCAPLNLHFFDIYNITYKKKNNNNNHPTISLDAIIERNKKWAYLLKHDLFGGMLVMI